MRSFRELVPPLGYRAVSNLVTYGRLRMPADFAGISNHPAKLPSVTQYAFDSDNWIDYQRTAPQEEPIEPYWSHQAALKLLCAQLECVDVFDFGGGPGVMYPIAQAAAKKLNYVVVENERLCEVGRAKFPKVRFFSNAANALKAVARGGITLCVSTLHYCIDYDGVLDLLVSNQPRYIIIGRHYTPPDGETLYAVQTVYSPFGYCGKAHIVLIPKDILIRAMLGRGYRLLCDLPLMDASTGFRGEDRRRVPVLLNRNFIFEALP